MFSDNSLKMKFTSFIREVLIYFKNIQKDCYISLNSESCNKLL